MKKTAIALIALMAAFPLMASAQSNADKAANAPQKLKHQKVNWHAQPQTSSKTFGKKESKKVLGKYKWKSTEAK